LSGAREGLDRHGLSALLIAIGADLVYLTGYDAILTERLTMLVLRPVGPASLVVPRLEVGPALDSPAAQAGLLEVAAWEETDDAIQTVAGLLEGEAFEKATRLGISDRLWAVHLLRLQSALPRASFESATSVMRELRIVKDPEEVELLRLAAQAADRVLDRIAHGPLIGRTEAHVSHEILEALVAEGHDVGDFAIVGSGPNSASPHHSAGDRVIAAGEPIVLDIGGLLGGYGSDVTRTIWVTGGDPKAGPDEEFLRIYELVRDAQSEATGSARPGTPAERIDSVARGIIGGGGRAAQFIHRTGHGIGLEGHEDPYLVEGNSEPVRPGMTFSIEPGVYLEGRYGVRIEDIVLCTEAGPVSLNEAPRDLLVVDGR
jgi:Xaa-Pro aminopeptidase